MVFNHDWLINESLISLFKNIFFSYKVNKPRLLIPELEADLLAYFPEYEVGTRRRAFSAFRMLVF